MLIKHRFGNDGFSVVIASSEVLRNGWSRSPSADLCPPITRQQQKYNDKQPGRKMMAGEGEVGCMITIEGDEHARRIDLGALWGL